jgi:raffinose/stachyose/melibiose transport system substrate-binding protein
MTMKITYLAAAVVGVAALTVACTPGKKAAKPTEKPTSAISTDVAAAGKVTLNVWDQEVRGGQNAEITQLNKEFMAKYPNVTIKRNSKSFTNLKDTLKLALSGKNPPDVVEANQGYPDMGAFVKAGFLQPLDSYSQKYNWAARYPKTLLDLNSFGANGTAFGSGTLYGISQTGEIVGIYYNKQKLSQLGIKPPATWADFEAALGKIKNAGQLPIAFGNKDQWPAIHEFGILQGQLAGKDAVRNLVFGKPGATWTSPPNLQAATKLATWARNGYLSPGTNGLGYDEAAAQFAKGKGVFLITGTWEAADLQPTMKNNLGFMLPPPATAGGSPVTTGGQGLAWSITAKSKHADVAASYLDFITDAHAADVMTQTGNLPATQPASAKPPAGTALADIFAAWKTISEADGEVPYLDYSTPSFYDTLTANLQKLLGGKQSPKDLLATLQGDYSDFQKSKK